jgi:hypothetical protein
LEEVRLWLLLLLIPKLPALLLVLWLLELWLGRLRCHPLHRWLLLPLVLLWLTWLWMHYHCWLQRRRCPNVLKAGEHSCGRVASHSPLLRCRLRLHAHP